MASSPAATTAQPLLAGGLAAGGGKLLSNDDSASALACRPGRDSNRASALLRSGGVPEGGYRSAFGPMGTRGHPESPCFFSLKTPHLNRLILRDGNHPLDESNSAKPEWVAGAIVNSNLINHRIGGKKTGGENAYA